MVRARNLVANTSLYTLGYLDSKKVMATAIEEKSTLQRTANKVDDMQRS
jgi:hypothetical protein